MEIMQNAPTPWVGLAALVAMFVLPYLPNWLLDGPRTVKHRPRRHICADCSAPWTSDHDCMTDLRELSRPLRGELRRPAGKVLDRRSRGFSPGTG